MGTAPLHNLSSGGGRGRARGAQEHRGVGHVLPRQGRQEDLFATSLLAGHEQRWTHERRACVGHLRASDMAHIQLPCITHHSGRLALVCGGARAVTCVPTLRASIRAARGAGEHRSPRRERGGSCGGIRRGTRGPSPRAPCPASRHGPQPRSPTWAESAARHSHLLTKWNVRHPPLNTYTAV
jgi:hypothetical protein